MLTDGKLPNSGWKVNASTSCSIPLAYVCRSAFASAGSAATTLADTTLLLPSPPPPSSWIDEQISVAKSALVPPLAEFEQTSIALVNASISLSHSSFVALRLGVDVFVLTPLKLYPK